MSQFCTIYLYPALYRFAGQDKIKIKILLVSIGPDSCVCHFVVLQFPKESLQTLTTRTLHLLLLQPIQESLRQKKNTFFHQQTTRWDTRPM